MTDVLLIDSDLSARFAFAMRLEAEGFAVQDAADAETGLDLARSLKPKLVLLGIESPVPGGWDFVRELMKDPELTQTGVLIYSATRDGRADDEVTSLIATIRRSRIDPAA